MRDFKYILLIGAFCFSILQIKAENFSEKTDQVSAVETTKIFPNPVVNDEDITINAGKEFEKIVIINIVGSEVYHEKISPVMIHNVSIEGLDKGIYLMKILYTDNTSIIKRFWVK
jgi:hypothetical protein